MVKSNCLVLLALLFLFGCGKKELSKQAYAAYVNDPSHGFIKSKEIGGLVFEAFYNTPEWMAVKEASSDETKKDLGNLVKEYEGLYYFNFRVKSAKEGEHVLSALGKNREDILAADSYMNFDMQQDFYLLDGTDTCACVLFAADKTYAVSKVLTFSLAFDKKNNTSNSDKELVYDDKTFGKGVIRFTILGKDILSIPRLKINA